MVDKLITAYRAKIYAHPIEKWKSLWKESRGIVLLLIFLAVSIPASIIAGCIMKVSGWAYAAAFLELIGFWSIDRYSIKKYNLILKRRQCHVDDIISFLQTTIPDLDLYNADKINELVVRLEERIEAKVPLKNFMNGIKNFAKAIILPMVTFIAGLYSSELRELGYETMIGFGVVVIVYCAAAYMLWLLQLIFIRTIFCRDYDATVSFREDLLDIKLLYLPVKETEKR
ncbi:hypothetical protein SDC9_72059 [bioreactor metagenome]|uniref:Uncharacterized protein n=1 Tax=bioreactor metagenome TaxID=1076179 RepID=A0A644YGD3_9ZZZZ